MRLALSSDGKHVASGGESTARVWEASTGKEITRMAHENFGDLSAFDLGVKGYHSRVTSLIFSLDGKYIVSGGSDRNVHVWEAATGKEVARILRNTRNVDAVAFSQMASM